MKSLNELLGECGGISLSFDKETLENMPPGGIVIDNSLLKMMCQNKIAAQKREKQLIAEKNEVIDVVENYLTETTDSAPEKKKPKLWLYMRWGFYITTLAAEIYFLIRHTNITL